ncbi:MAG: zinc ABC transporter substrate-binding protein [Alphaproteobacteria bacterium]|nr:zinc ABC transporter substrate-binding protein [Alphaproteobacteria bacterium]
MMFKVIFIGLFWLLSLAKATSAAPVVVVSTAPIHSVVASVMDRIGTPELLLPPAVSVHDFYLKPSDMHRLAHADVVFWGGEELETALIKALQATGKESQSVSVLKDPRLTLLPARGADHHDEKDGHFWLMPENMIAVAEIAAEKLSALDPENALLYRKNAERLKERIISLKNEGKKELKAYARAPYVVFHDAYQYFEKSFGLSPLGALFVDPHHAAGASRISETREKIKKAGTVCLFSEPQFSDKRIKIAAEGLPVIFGRLDPLGSTFEPGKNFYFELMENLFRSFAECLIQLPEK